MAKIKQFIQSKEGKDVLTVIIIILVGIGSFGLGRLSVDSQKSELRVLKASLVDGSAYLEEVKALSTSDAYSNPNKDKKYFASIKGSKYYPIGCSAGKSIKIENRKYFSSKEDAEKSGYELSSSCK
jgi:hypothetical protein